MEYPQGPQNRHLLLGTVSFTVCFAAWGMISAFAPHFRQLLHMSATQTALLVAVPVLLGALARIPMGMLTDRFGGRIVFTVLMFFVAVSIPPVRRGAILTSSSTWLIGWDADNISKAGRRTARSFSAFRRRRNPGVRCRETRKESPPRLFRGAPVGRGNSNTESTAGQRPSRWSR